MKKILLFATALCIAIPASTNAAPRTKRDQARADCEQQANSMRIGKGTVMRRNFVRDCMVDKGFQSR
jgi:hypothetical protein